MDLVQRLLLTLAIVAKPEGIKVIFHALEKGTRAEWDGGVFEISPERVDEIAKGPLTLQLVMAPKNMLAFDIPVTEYEKLRDASKIVAVSRAITGVDEIVPDMN
jgi:hypothetical protein